MVIFNKKKKTNQHLIFFTDAEVENDTELIWDNISLFGL